MERNSFLYKARRKVQLLASMLLPDIFLCKLYSFILLRKRVDLKKPKTFNEKIQWMKLNYYPDDKLVIQCADKYRVREYLKSKGLEEILVPLYEIYDNASKIDFVKLPNQFVLKCNHGCAYNIVVENKDKINNKTVVQQLNKWLKEDFGAFNVERHYSKIEPLITCEKYLGACITDYKFFCFNGEPKYIYVSSDLLHDRKAKLGFFYLNGEKIPLIRDDYDDIGNVIFPKFFDEMLNDARKLCADFPFVRVDFFVMRDRYYFAELTFTPGGGMMPFNPKKFDYIWGNDLDLSKIYTLKH